MHFLIRLLGCAGGLTIAAWLLPGIFFIGPSDGNAEMEGKVIQLLSVALILTVVNAIVRPLIKALSFPLIVVTLGLFMLVINALMLLLTAGIAEEVGLDFQVDNFYSAGIGAVIITTVGWLVDFAVDDD